VNLVVGLFTVTLGRLRRWGGQKWTTDDLTLVVVMVGRLARGVDHRLPSGPPALVAAPETGLHRYLLVVGVWTVFEAVTHAEYVLINRRVRRDGCSPPSSVS
jgi:hypothetical protein